MSDSRRIRTRRDGSVDQEYYLALGRLERARQAHDLLNVAAGGLTPRRLRTGRNRT